MQSRKDRTRITLMTLIKRKIQNPKYYETVGGQRAVPLPSNVKKVLNLVGVGLKPTLT